MSHLLLRGEESHGADLTLLSIVKDRGVPEGVKVGLIRALCLQVGDQNGADVHFFGDACIRHAVRVGGDEVVMALVELGADVTSEGWDAVKEALRRGRHVDVVRALVKRGVEVEGKVNEEVWWTALESSDEDTCLLLLSSSPSLPTSSAATHPLILSCRRSFKRLARALLSHPDLATLPKEIGEQALADACDAEDRTWRDADEAAMRVRMGTDHVGSVAAVSENEAVIVPAVDLSIVRALVDEKNVDPAVADHCVARLACLAGDLEWVQKLATERYVHVRDDEMLRNAASVNHTALISHLHSLGADPDALETDALIQSSLRGHIPATTLLLELGADLAAQDDFALRSACGAGHTELATMLLDVGADLHADEDDALARAAAGGHVDVVRLLLAR
ncbi:hypothetical protein HK101_006621, partial [Irineochytrium annulatum]